MFDFWPVYSGERFRASWPSCSLKVKVFNVILVALTCSIVPQQDVRCPSICSFVGYAVCQLLRQSFVLNFFDCSCLCNHVSFSSYLVYDISVALPLITAF